MSNCHSNDERVDRERGATGEHALRLRSRAFKRDQTQHNIQQEQQYFRGQPGIHDGLLMQDQSKQNRGVR
jgi:hypothetical protein